MRSGPPEEVSGKPKGCARHSSSDLTADAKGIRQFPRRESRERDLMRTEQLEIPALELTEVLTKAPPLTAVRLPMTRPHSIRRTRGAHLC